MKTFSIKYTMARSFDEALYQKFLTQTAVSKGSRDKVNGIDAVFDGISIVFRSGNEQAMVSLNYHCGETPDEQASVLQHDQINLAMVVQMLMELGATPA